MKWILILLIAVGTANAQTKPLFRDFMGINGHTIQFKPELYAPVATLVRDYHPVEWDLGKDSDFATTFPFARNRVNWESVYGSWRKHGLRVDVSLMFETLSREKWKNLATDSRAYAESFARAFGPLGKMPLVESVEIGNEPGKFSDADYRTIFENMARGFRAADPKLKVATGAVTTGKSHDYAKSVTCIEGFEDLYDVLNVHSYAELQGWPTWKRSFPEDPALKNYLPDIRKLCEWRDAHAKGKEVWLTEFGYDSTTKTPDPKTEFKQWVGVTDEQQAQWLVRSFLIFATLPIDRAYIYFFNDTDQPQIHGAAGLTRNFQPKPSFHAVAHLRKTLGDFSYARTVLEKPGDVMIQEFVKEKPSAQKIWVAWSPTGNGRKAKIQLPLAGMEPKRVQRMPIDKSPGADASISKDGTVEISESPIYIFF
jgi:hypothetical protein